MNAKRRALFVIATLVCAVARHTLAQAASPPPSAPAPDPEPVLIDLRIGSITARTVPAFRLDDDVLLPVGALFDLAEIGYQRAESGRINAPAFDHGRGLSIEPANDTMRAGSRRVVAQGGTILLHEGELYVASAALAELLSVRVAVDWEDLAVIVQNPGALPIAQRLRRESTRQRFLEHRSTRQTVAPELMLGQARTPWDGLVLDYTLISPGESPLRESTYAVALGALAMGGSLDLSLASAGPAAGPETAAGAEAATLEAEPTE